MENTIYITVIYMSIMLAIFAIFYYFKNKLRTKDLDNNMKIINSLGIGPKQKLLLVEVNEEQILIGMSQSNISKIHNFVTQSDHDEKDFSTKIQDVIKNAYDK